MAKSRKDPFDVTLDDDKRQDLANWLADEIMLETAARGQVIDDGGDLDYYWALYEQGSTRVGSDRPWDGAADLTSFLGTQYVDAFSSRVAKTIFVEPIWTVEGWGDAAQRAPLVEEFHQWKAESKDERLQGIVQRVFRPSFIEGTGVLEVSERAAVQNPMRQRSTRQLKVETGPDQAPVIGENAKPKLAVDPATGQYVDGTPGAEPVATTVVDELVKVPGGPAYRILNLKDFLILPGHARDKSEIWGRAKRFWRRIPDLQARAKSGYYDADAVEKLGNSSEREQTPADIRAGQTIASQKGDTVQKELWEVQCLKDLDGNGERWYVATVSVIRRVILRLKYDDLGEQRFVLFTPFPRSDSLYGYSLIQKILTLIEEHTAIRNQIADRAHLANSKPIKRLQGALWDPDEVPWAPGAVMDVRDMREVEEMQIADVPNSLIDRERTVLGAAERVSGMNDVALGTTPQEDRTLGEVNLVAQQSFIRIDEVIRNIQEAMEELFDIRHRLYVRALQAAPSGMAAPSSLAAQLKRRVGTFDGSFTADMLAGQFRGKPRGSSDTSDLMSLRGDLNGLLPIVGKLFPEVLQDTEAKKSLFEQIIRVYRYQDRQALLEAFDKAQAAAQAQAQAAAAQPPPAQPGAPGAPGQPPPMPPHPMNVALNRMPPPGMMPPGAPPVPPTMGAR